MSAGIENIGKRDIVWSYAATVFMVGAGVILFPFILNKMSAETVGIWTIFQTITMLVLLLDFGFRPSFARNISYIFSGVKQLQVNGVAQVSSDDTDIDYSLLKGTITAMQKFYRWMALGVLLLLGTIGTAYMLYILKHYDGDHTDALVAWVILIAINCYNLYTFYYDALLLGKGYIKRNQQITILGQSIYLITAIVLIYTGFGLTAIVGAQLLSTLIRRILSYHVFFTKELRARLEDSESQDTKSILQAIFPNAVKVGLTSLGGFCINKSAILLGSAFLSLEQVACYGITMQVMDVIGRVSMVPFQVYTPKLAQCRAENDLIGLGRYYKLNVLSLLLIFICGGAALLLFGDWALDIIHSETQFLPTNMLVAMLVITFLEDNHATAAGFIMADNKIPFFIPSLVSGAATLILMWTGLAYLNAGTWALILAPGIAQLAYQNWKWPSVIIKELVNGIKEQKEAKQETNILHVVNIYFALLCFMGDQFKHFKEKGCNMYVACSPDEHLDGYAKQQGFEYMEVNVARSISPIKDCISIYHIAKYIRYNNINIVVGHTPKGALLAMTAGTLTGVRKRVYFRHGLTYETSSGLKRVLLQWADRFTSLLATDIVCVSEAVMERSIEDKLAPRSKQIILGQGTCNGIDTTGKFNPANIIPEKQAILRKRHNIKEGDYVIGYTGRLVRDKGISDLTAAFSLLPKSMHAKLLLVGMFEDRDALPEEVRQRILNDEDIIYTGFINDDIEYYYSLMDLYVLPSYREGFPTGVLEAQAMQVPVITTRATGCRNSIVEGVGGYFCDHTPESISQMIMKEHANPLNGTKAREWVCANFDCSVIWPYLDKLYLGK